MDFSQWSPSHLLVVAITLLAFGGQLIAILTYLKITAKQHSIENINWKMARASARFFTFPVVCLFAISSVAQANITGGGSLDSTIVPYFPQGSEKHFTEVPKDIQEGIKFLFVEHVTEVFTEVFA